MGDAREMKNAGTAALLAAIVTGCATASTVKKDEALLPVYLETEPQPVCAYKEIAHFKFSNNDKTEGEEFERAVKRDLSHRARERGADAVINASYETIVKGVVESGHSILTGTETSRKTTVEGTAIKFDNPGCQH